MKRKVNRFKTRPMNKNISPVEMKRIKVSMELAEAIKNVLMKRNITRTQFAKMMGQDKKVISVWLSGTYNFNLGTLYEIVDRLGLM
ncbi:helix-turn-helix transcriptional regulator [Pedobacter frigoris]|uniref:Helix-turn-helix transcriptional regulator n=2 Tax=Pedobacter frigoris TaxID=2571272 RepID=A0A4U1CIX6_9SPHI|nr:helix-turn-helix transcriptional regulator [Pedobacter frigoris]